ncbi:MAG: RHS repeat-associated core domain-containing protein [Xanthomonadales bacterium]|nr:RHS repeat-associated core domain-containing protein [Xanthomonadales bacterium]
MDRVGGRDVATYAHNARGERVHKSAPKAGSATLFVYAEGGQLLGEYDGDGNVLQEYAWLDALPVAVLKKGGPYPIEPDHLGTPRRAIAAELDRAVWAWDLQGPAFGTHPANDDPDADGQPFPLNLRFPGQYLDAESGLHYNYFRDYDPATGRYVESDPVGLRGGVSMFGYVGNAPIRYSDPLGLCACKARTQTKRYAEDPLEVPRQWWPPGAKQVTITCQYDCVDRAGNRSVVTASHVATWWTKQGEGQVFLCIGVPVQEHFSTFNNWYVYSPMDPESFDPRGSSSSELRDWGRRHCKCSSD